MSELTQRTKAHLLAGAATAGALVLYLLPPETHTFYPRCPVFQYLHVYCPGCGATRALAALLHGRIADALHYNCAVTLLAPVAAWFALKAYWDVLHEKPLAYPEVPPAALKIIFAALLLFAVFRNLHAFAI